MNQTITNMDEKGKDADQQPDSWIPWRPEILNNVNSAPPVCVKSSPSPVWDIEKVLKAACLLCKPPMKVKFVDEPEMRCIYSIVYDVFRYKTILDVAINDSDFFPVYPEHLNHRHLVWLFVMELARRKWETRAREEGEKAITLLQKMGFPFEDIEKAVWKHRVHFAAAISRIRIKNKAFSLSALLPPHLREERISACVNKETITGWVNTFKAKKVANLVRSLHSLGYSYSGSKQLCAGEYRFDRVCPRFITLRPPSGKIGELSLIKEGVIVLQEREFCEGASTLCRAIRANSIKGAVAQTHASSARCSAYLAAQLRDLAMTDKGKTSPNTIVTPSIGKLIVFGAGDKIDSYLTDLRNLGVEASSSLDAPVQVISDFVYCDTPEVNSALEGVVAVLATPPNSYSGVSDPIDLVCGRGGDITMLEILTESEVNREGKARVLSILDEQKKTLKALLSKPQIQLILYETHSILEAENKAQVTRAVNEANKLARERHVYLKKKRSGGKVRPETANSITSIDSMDINLENGANKDEENNLEQSQAAPQVVSPKNTDNNNAKEVVLAMMATARPIPGLGREPTTESENKEDDIPDTDIFHIQALPTLGNGLDIDYITARDGCYLALIKRKEVNRLDAKYMIDVAEERGLFSATQPAPVVKKKTTTHSNTHHKKRPRTSAAEAVRIAAPTYASMVRSNQKSATTDDRAPPPPPVVCQRHARRQAAAGAVIAACTCSAHHTFRPKRISRFPPSNSPPPLVHAQNSPHKCRQPFPVVIKDVHLVTVDEPFSRNLFGIL